MYSKETYAGLLQTIFESGYRFVSFDNLDLHSSDRQIILRHDVDASPQLALEIAKVDASYGVKAIFCVLLRSQLYNLLSNWTLDILGEIVTLGHDVGFHYALPSKIPESDPILMDMVQTDFELARAAFPAMKPIFAWHMVTPDVLRRGLQIDFEGLTNAYSECYFSTIKYISDSNARYMPSELEAFFRSGEHTYIHLLIHPLIWIAGGRSMIEVWINTWKYIIRDRELELIQNNVYGRQFPFGVSEGSLELFTSSLIST